MITEFVLAQSIGIEKDYTKWQSFETNLLGVYEGRMNEYLLYFMFTVIAKILRINLCYYFSPNRALVQ